MLGFRKQFHAGVDEKRIPAILDAYGMYLNSNEITEFQFQNNTSFYGTWSFWVRSYHEYAGEAGTTFIEIGFKQGTSPGTRTAFKVGMDHFTLGHPTTDDTITTYEHPSLKKYWNHYCYHIKTADGSGDHTNDRLWINGTEVSLTTPDDTPPTFPSAGKGIWVGCGQRSLGPSGTAEGVISEAQQLDICQLSFYSDTYVDVANLYLKNLGESGYNSPTLYYEFRGYPFLPSASSPYRRFYQGARSEGYGAGPTYYDVVTALTPTTANLSSLVKDESKHTSSI
jgi:hypothetical protein